MTLSQRPAEAAPVSANFFAVASPLWAYYGAAVATGLAVWSMTRMARTANLEAFLAAPTPPVVPDLLAAPAALPQPVLEAETAPVLEVAPEPVTPEPPPLEPVLVADAVAELAKAPVVRKVAASKPRSVPFEG